MIIIRIAGGLGNQMQQYALGRKLQSLGREVKYDRSWFSEEEQARAKMPRELELLRFRDLKLPFCTEEEKRKFTGSTLGKLARKLAGKLGAGAGKMPAVFEESEMFHPGILEMTDGYLQGYFACNKYYEDILPQLRQDFAFPESEDPEINAWNREIMEEMLAPGVFSVAIHIRRGDYLDSGNAELLGGICTPEYYESAVKYLEGRSTVRLPDTLLRLLRRPCLRANLPVRDEGTGGHILRPQHGKRQPPRHAADELLPRGDRREFHLQFLGRAAERAGGPDPDPASSAQEHADPRSGADAGPLEGLDVRGQGRTDYVK